MKSSRRGGTSNAADGIRQGLVSEPRIPLYTTSRCYNLSYNARFLFSRCSLYSNVTFSDMAYKLS